MPEELREIQTWPLAARLAGQLEGAWTVVVPDDQSEIAATEFSTQLSSLLRKEVRHLRVGRAEDLVDGVAAASSDAPLLILGLDAFDTEAWRHLDANRSRLERSGHTVAVVAEACIGTMAEQAPNLWSWIGASTWRLRNAPSLTAEARADRLVALRAQYQIDDDELVRRALSGDLTSDPHLAEWLVLIGRGDLAARTENDDGPR